MHSTSSKSGGKISKRKTDKNSSQIKSKAYLSSIQVRGIFFEIFKN